jgi:hypothetical protein
VRRGDDVRRELGVADCAGDIDGRKPRRDFPISSQTSAVVADALEFGSFAGAMLFGEDFDFAGCAGEDGDAVTCVCDGHCFPIDVDGESDGAEFSQIFIVN